MPIELAKERLIIARLVLAILRSRQRHLYPQQSLAASMELQMVASAVFIGQTAGKPMGASEIARYIEMPRATVIRKLHELSRRKYVIQKGRTYRINEDAVNGDGAAVTVRGNVRRVMAAARELSKLDENPTKSDT